jgi:hypothetical protein
MEKRDSYTRCQLCGEVFHHDSCILDEVKGYQCPNGCQPSFDQPPYQSPLQDEKLIE